MRQIKCPRCGAIISAQDYDTDIIHQCTLSDNTTRKFSVLGVPVAGRQIMNIDDKNINIAGINPPIGGVKATQYDTRHRTMSTIAVDQYIEIGGN